MMVTPGYEGNENYGFECLHYAVTECVGEFTIRIINKKLVKGKVRVSTIEGDAKAGEHFQPFENDEIIFKEGEQSVLFKVTIFDDDQWEPNRDFYVQLKDASTNADLVGADTKTCVTIIDDDQPGKLCFFPSKQKIDHPRSENQCAVTVER